MKKKQADWRDATLQDLVYFQRGFDISQVEQEAGAIPVISSSGTKSYHSEAKVKSPGVIIGRKGTLGSIYYSRVDYWPHSTTLWSKDLKGNDARFVYYFLHTLKLERLDTGNSNPTLNRNHIHKISIKIPPLPIQQKIADILSKYDDLIENNRRRIELLERSARLLYKEWFVRLRFPGHEHTPIIDGIPEGWEKKTLGDVGFLNYGKTLKQENRISGNYPVFGSSGIIGTHNRFLVKGPGIIIGRKGNIGSVYYANDDYYPIDTAYYINASSTSFYLYHALVNTSFINTDAAVPGLNRDVAHKTRLLMPDSTLKTLFEKFATPIYKQIFLLKKQNQKLKQARDILLPKLMNGEIEV